MSKRDEIISEAMTWFRTPWHHCARIKGVGVDCAQFLIGVYVGVGLIPEPNIAPYPRDWHLHKEEPRFLNQLLKYADKVEVPQAGDIIMFKYARHAAHGGIMLDETKVIHAWLDEKMVTITDLTVSPIAGRVAGFYKLKGLE